MYVQHDDLKASALALIDGETNLIANLANLSSLFFYELPDLNWAGFYLWDEKSQELVLGPFQGRPACIRIKPGRGVCGQAFQQKKPLIVDDVHAFEGHIACDSASRSEMVIPIIVGSQVMGVLDLDSPQVARFTADDLARIQPIVEELAYLWKAPETQ